MKKHISVFMLMARSTIYKIIGLFGLMGVIEWSLFYARLKQGMTGDKFHLELVIEESHISWVFGIAFVLISILLMSTGRETSTKLGYTLKRLSISERWVFFWQAVYNMICYFMFWCMQILLVFLFCKMYEGMAPTEYVTNQTVFLAFYRSDFLHSLLPMEDAFFWTRNVFLLLALSICSAEYPMELRRNGKGKEIIVLMIACDTFFIGELGEMFSVIIILGVCIICMLTTIFRVFEKETEYGEI